MSEHLVVVANGRLVPPDAPAVGATDAGLLGQGVYESIRTYDRRIFALEQHLGRLADGAAALGIAVSLAALREEVPAAAHQLLAGDFDGEVRVKVVVTAGGARIVVADALPDRSAERAAGLAAVLLPWPRRPDGPTAGVKATSTAATLVGQRYARERDAATGIWLTPEGNVSEALTANVFAIDRDGALVCPPLADGALAGVTRGELLAWAAADGVPVVERSLPAGELAAAPEAFLSATSEPVVPLVRLDGAPIADGAAGPVTRRLQGLFERRARESVRA